MYLLAYTSPSGSTLLIQSFRINAGSAWASQAQVGLAAASAILHRGRFVQRWAIAGKGGMGRGWSGRSGSRRKQGWQKALRLPPLHARSLAIRAPRNPYDPCRSTTRAKPAERLGNEQLLYYTQELSERPESPLLSSLGEVGSAASAHKKNKAHRGCAPVSSGSF